jgi:predicted AlkP superfamily pyrophosphatase or phosphodiesterase
MRAILCSIDGLRPDALKAAETPTIRGLIENGAVSWTARTVMPSVTLPCHMSMLRGVEVSRHGVATNRYQPPSPPVPSLIDAAHAAGLRTGSFYNWEPLRDVADPGSLNVAYLWADCHSAEGDRRVADAVVEHLGRIDLDLLFVYLGYPDEAGHHDGWMSEGYLAAVENADRCLGDVLTASAACGQGRPTTVLVTSDHGGHDHSHGSDRDEDMTVPWVLRGPGVRRGHVIQQPVRILDTCVTLARVLGIEPSPEWTGAVVAEAFGA